MIIALTVIAVLYVILILAFGYSWRDEDGYIAMDGSVSDAPFVSVVVAFRNEEGNISQLIDSLLAQTYKKCEFILVDDHSDDASLQVVRSYSDSRIKVVCMPDDIFGKKATLRLGYENSKGEILYFTDADCIMGSRCIEALVSRMAHDHCAMMCGPVCYSDGKGFFNKIIQLEFLSLTGSGAAGFFMDRPFMCNGANFAVERKVYAEADLNAKYSSGDDVFLLHYAQKKYKVGFAQNVDCIVETKAPGNLAEFLAQRVRWASKAGGYKNLFSILVSLLILLMSFVLLVSIVYACINPIYLIVFFCIFVMKLVSDTYFIIQVLRFYGRRRLLWAVVPMSLLYPLYIVFVAIASLVYRPMWKGRRVSA